MVDPNLMTTDEVCKYLGIKRVTVYLWRRQGKFTPAKVVGGRKLLFKREEVEAQIKPYKRPKKEEKPLDTKRTAGNLHVYPQEQWHDSAFIIADQPALRALRDLIDKVLAPGDGLAEKDFWASDGEGYTLHVINLEGDEGWNKIGRPYTSEMAQDKRGESAVWPWQILKKRKENLS